MIDHLSLGVRDLAASRRFYDAALAPLGYRCLSEDAASLGYGRESAALWLLRTDHPVAADPRSGLHVCLKAGDRAGVDAFHAAALAHGGRDNGAPACVPITVRTTTPPSSPIRTATGWRPTSDDPLELQPDGCAFTAAGAGYMQPGGGI
jgi:catechol 2,3-dioxygenase-like lactoylglutathione lyase family enzyme